MIEDEARRGLDDAAARRTSAFDDAADVEAMINAALSAYGVRVLDNLDLTKVTSQKARARLVGIALLDRGDARAFFMGRKLLAAAARA